ncbi:flagellar hook-basal body complex protein FliE [Alicyclobacillus acidocaldarius]|uniref:Flagellar hook-basal body complex protein FliE n=1 Tax=Alicyclobacillus acidocaldarius subsp. acidocaldarius (strain ATCC 27009 / DSM 446 / BCRC 14685 / JCM 5260 / KCTC 1825 / NBRC 15652 / NCIMB 11725 / NRRL B-14509 / 104-IA) TaxID=521098 RepID=C8WVM9_ALIAD|nr:flagellar hook-basal body complex protein FliE [Alicyclobacillus acidocaldarius]ACV58151.1 flagellar hook-basal body complex protein FliE [Alicyclobacillus acidocaldarius subsp. acidocaldarius DSM 446]
MIAPVTSVSLAGVGPAASAGGAALGGMSFSDYLGEALDAVNQAAARADQLAVEYASGGPVSTADLMIAGTQASLAVDMLSQVATRVQQAYTTLMNMQI